MAKFTGLRIGAAIAAVNDIRETRWALIVWERRRWVVDAWASNVNVASTCQGDDFVDWVETCSFDESEETAVCNGLTWDGGRAVGAPVARRIVFRGRSWTIV